MEVTVRGWSRDMGAKHLLACSLRYQDPIEHVDRYKRGECYFRINRSVREGPRGRRRVDYQVLVSSHAEVNMNGSYLVQLELSRDEIARLFYLTNGDRGLPELLGLFKDFGDEERVGKPRDP